MKKNIYQIEVGTPTKNGGFIKHHSFVCQSEHNYTNVVIHYRTLYLGFEIFIKEVVDIDTPNIIVQQPIPFDEENKNLKIELQELKNKKRSLSRSISISDLPPNIKDIRIEMTDAYKVYLEKRSFLNNEIQTHLNLKYTLISNNIEITKHIEKNESNLEFTIRLNGTLI